MSSDPIPSSGDEATRWSRIQERDYEYLALRFWNPVYRFLKSRLSSPEEAQELAQEVFLRFMEKDLLERASVERGSFRSFLFHVVRQMLVDHYRARSAAKRGADRTVPIDDLAREAADQGLTPAEAFDREWYESLINRARAALKDHYERRGRTDTYRAFRLFVFGDRRPGRLSHQEIAEKLGLTMGQVRNHISRARAVFRQALEDAISEYASPGEEVEGEISDFRDFLDRHRLHGLASAEIFAEDDPDPNSDPDSDPDSEP